MVLEWAAKHLAPQPAPAGGTGSSSGPEQDDVAAAVVVPLLSTVLKDAVMSQLHVRRLVDMLVELTSSPRWRRVDGRTRSQVCDLLEVLVKQVPCALMALDCLPQLAAVLAADPAGSTGSGAAAGGGGAGTDDSVKLETAGVTSAAGPSAGGVGGAGGGNSGAREAGRAAAVEQLLARNAALTASVSPRYVWRGPGIQQVHTMSFCW